MVIIIVVVFVVVISLAIIAIFIIFIFIIIIVLLVNAPQFLNNEIGDSFFGLPADAQQPVRKGNS